MIVSVHLADVGRLSAQRLLLRRLDAAKVPGMTYAEPVRQPRSARAPTGSPARNPAGSD